MKFRSKLYVGFGSILLFILILSYMGFHLLTLLKNNMQVVVGDSYMAVKLAMSIRGEINNISRETNGILIKRDDNDLDTSLANILLSKQNVERDWAHISRLPNQLVSEELLGSIIKTYTDFNESLDTLIRLEKSNRHEEALSYYYGHAEAERAELMRLIQEFTNTYNVQIEEKLSDSNEAYRTMLAALAAFVLLILLLAFVITGWVMRSATGSLNKVAEVMMGISFPYTGGLPKIAVTVKDEIGHIAHSYNQMAAALEQYTEESLAYQRELQGQNQQKTRTAEMLSLFQGIHDVEELTAIFIDQVTPELGAGYGAFYWTSQQGQGAAQRLVKLSEYAGSGLQAEREELAVGEGLVGQCLKTNKSIIVDEVPDSYIRIHSGLGSSAPLHLLIMPVPFEGKAIGVVELASFRPFKPCDINLLEEVVHMFGINLNSAASYMQIQRLLSESQTITEELQTQSEELQLQQEELSALNEQLEEQYTNSERKNQELEKARADLEETNKQVLLNNQYKSEFMANVSHELRTPLNSLLLLAQLLTENKEGNLLPKQLEYLKTIRDSGTDLLHLISEILDLAKIESGKMEVISDRIRLAALGEFAGNQFQVLAQQKGLDFRVVFEEGIANRLVYTDEAKVQQILKNLLSNAIKFTSRGSVTLTFRHAGEEELALLEGREMAAYLAICVSDTGIGIPMDKQTMIFEAFRQADGTTSRKYGGTGLGLSISKELAMVLKGVIVLNSEEDRGSTFMLLLPFKDREETDRQQPYYGASGESAASEAAPAAAAVSPNAGLAESLQMMEEAKQMKPLEGKKILIVDDDMRNIFALTSVLESFGIQTVFAENGQEGLAMLEKHPDTDLILMDVMMPKMDGYEATRAIRQSNAAYQDIAIIALTAKAMKNDREKCIEAGADDYISKPIHFEQLFSLLRVWLHP